MNNNKTHKKGTVEIDDSQITRMLHKNAEETISDEQVARVMEPISEMIFAGHFAEYQTPPKQKRRWIYMICTIAAVLVVTIAGGYFLNFDSEQSTAGTYTEITDPGIPLAGEPPGITTTEQIRLVFLSEIGESNLDAINTYSEIPEGIWEIMVTVDGEEVQAGTLIIDNGIVRLKQ